MTQPPRALQAPAPQAQKALPMGSRRLANQKSVVLGNLALFGWLVGWVSGWPIDWLYRCFVGCDFQMSAGGVSPSS